MKHKLIHQLKILLPALCAVLLFVFPAYADIPVDLSIEIQTKQDGASVMPREKVDYSLTVHNTGGKAWLRVNLEAKLEFTDKQIDITDFHFTDDWFYNQKDGCFYLKTVARTGTDWQLFDYFVVPDVNQMEYAGQKGRLQLSVYAEAIQYSAVDPDYSRDDPWSGASDPTPVIHVGGGGGVVSGFITYRRPGQTGVPCTGSWVAINEKNKEWKFQSTSGMYATGGWIYTYNPYAPGAGQYDWFCFDEKGMLKHGWVLSDGSWFYTHNISDGNLGRLEKGWHNDPEDGYTYFLDMKDGAMITGWYQIDNNWYYFTRSEDVSGQNWFWDTNLGQWIYKKLNRRTQGSMWRNENTPDGYHVNQNGVRDGKAGNTGWIREAFAYFSGVSETVTNRFSIQSTIETVELDIIEGADDRFAKSEWYPGDRVTKVYKLRMKGKSARQLNFRVDNFRDSDGEVKLGDVLKCRVTVRKEGEESSDLLYDGLLKDARKAFELPGLGSGELVLEYNVTVYLPEETDNTYAGFQGEGKEVSCDFRWDLEG